MRLIHRAFVACVLSVWAGPSYGAEPKAVSPKAPRVEPRLQACLPDLGTLAAIETIAATMGVDSDLLTEAIKDVEQQMTDCLQKDDDDGKNDDDIAIASSDTAFVVGGFRRWG